MAPKTEREKVNFMLNRNLVIEFRTLVPEGKRSDFVNGVLEEAITSFRAKKASEGIDQLRKENKVYLSTKEIIRLRDEGRR